MIARYYRRKSTELRLARIAGTTPEHGTSAAGLAKAARSVGLQLQIKDEASFADIEQLLIEGTPPIVDWFSTSAGHYSVVVGLDKRYIYLQDPELGRVRRMKREVFLTVWFDFPHEYLRSKDELILRRLIIIKKL